MQPLLDRVQFAKGIRCSHCGADLAFNAELQAVACNFCGHQLSLDDLRQIEIVRPDGIVPFSTSKEAFTAAALNWLVEGTHVPDDVLDKANFAENVGIYIPAVRYEGSYSADWNCQVGIDKQEQELVRVNGKLESRTRHWVEWHPRNGSAHGAYRFLACGSTVLPDSLKSFVEQLRLKDVRAYDERILLGFAQEHITTDLDPSALFNSRVESQLNELIGQSVRGQISGAHVKDVRYSYRYNPENPVRLLVPVWLLSYEYGGVQHRIIADGGNVAEITGSRPEDLERKKRLQRPPLIGGGIAGGGALLAFSGLSAHQPVLGHLGEGVLTGGLVFAAAALLHRSRELNLSRNIRKAALAAYQANANFDVSAELQKRRQGVLGGARFLKTSSIAAGVVGLGAALFLMLRPAAPTSVPPTVPSTEPAAAELGVAPQAAQPTQASNDAAPAAPVAPSGAPDAQPAVEAAATTANSSEAPAQAPAAQTADAQPVGPAPGAQPAQPEFACNSATNGWARQVVCATPALAAADTRLNALVSARMSATQDFGARARLHSEQRAFTFQLGTCETRSDPVACLQSAYDTRIGALSAMAAQTQQAQPNAPALSPHDQELVAYSTEQIKECLRVQNLDCAESNLKIILKLQPNRPDAVQLLNKIQDERRKAFAGSWNVH